MSDLSEQLREARESQGITLEQAEAVTHIRRALLLAIEEGRYSELSGDVYGRGLVRNYARYLGLDPDAAVQEFSRHSGRPEQVVPEVLDEPLANAGRRVSWLPALFVAVILGILGWLIYTSVSRGQGLSLPEWWPFGQAVTEQATANPPLAGTGTPDAVTPEATATAPVAEGQGTPTAEPTVTTIPLPTRRPEATATPAYQGVYVEALANADTYVEATADGTRIYTGIMQANDTAQWQAEQVLVLRVGNAGGLSLLVNGHDVGSLGANGEVINLEYRVDNLPGE
ncbi:MAG: RodZ domain-containing protein [Anaerolineae bacterium]|nr:helix-turn-helix domain-containing protein [Chloroflexota bacterium]